MKIMNKKEIREIILEDMSRNNHPRNRVFIWLYRWGQYYYSKRKEDMLDRVIYFVLHVLMRIIYNDVGVKRPPTNLLLN